jgi:ketosteroid isomerase-like protein
MPEQNVELHRRAIEAFNAGDVEAFIALGDRQVEFHSLMTTPGGTTYHGHDGVRRYFGDPEDAWGGDFRIEPEAYFGIGEYTLAFLMAHGRGSQSGAPVEMPQTQVARWRDGLCVYFKAYVHREEALKDLGVSEDALEPIAP